MQRLRRTSNPQFSVFSAVDNFLKKTAQTPPLPPLSREPRVPAFSRPAPSSQIPIPKPIIEPRQKLTPEPEQRPELSQEFWPNNMSPEAREVLSSTYENTSNLLNSLNQRESGEQGIIDPFDYEDLEFFPDIHDLFEYGTKEKKVRKKEDIADKRELLSGDNLATEKFENLFNRAFKDNGEAQNSASHLLKVLSYSLESMVDGYTPDNINLFIDTYESLFGDQSLLSEITGKQEGRVIENLIETGKSSNQNLKSVKEQIRELEKVEEEIGLTPEQDKALDRLDREKEKLEQSQNITIAPLSDIYEQIKNIQVDSEQIFSPEKDFTTIRTFHGLPEETRNSLNAVNDNLEANYNKLEDLRRRGEPIDGLLPDYLSHIRFLTSKAVMDSGLNNDEMADLISTAVQLSQSVEENGGAKIVEESNIDEERKNQFGAGVFDAESILKTPEMKFTTENVEDQANYFAMSSDPAFEDVANKIFSRTKRTNDIKYKQSQIMELKEKEKTTPLTPEEQQSVNALIEELKVLQSEPNQTISGYIRSEFGEGTENIVSDIEKSEGNIFKLYSEGVAPGPISSHYIKKNIDNIYNSLGSEIREKGKRKKANPRFTPESVFNSFDIGESYKALEDHKYMAPSVDLERIENLTSHILEMQSLINQQVKGKTTQQSDPEQPASEQPAFTPFDFENLANVYSQYQASFQEAQDSLVEIQNAIISEDFSPENIFLQISEISKSLSKFNHLINLSSKREPTLDILRWIPPESISETIGELENIKQTDPQNDPDYIGYFNNANIGLDNLKSNIETYIQHMQENQKNPDQVGLEARDNKIQKKAQITDEGFAITDYHAPPEKGDKTGLSYDRYIMQVKKNWDDFVDEYRNLLSQIDKSKNSSETLNIIRSLKVRASEASDQLEQNMEFMAEPASKVLRNIRTISTGIKQDEEARGKSDGGALTKSKNKFIQENIATDPAVIAAIEDAKSKMLTQTFVDKDFEDLLEGVISGTQRSLPNADEAVRQNLEEILFSQSPTSIIEKIIKPMNLIGSDHIAAMQENVGKYVPKAIEPLQQDELGKVKPVRTYSPSPFQVNPKDWVDRRKEKKKKRDKSDVENIEESFEYNEPAANPGGFVDVDAPEFGQDYGRRSFNLKNIKKKAYTKKAFNLKKTNNRIAYNERGFNLKRITEDA